MTENLEKLEKQWVLDEDIEHEDIETLIEQAAKFCKIDKKGHVLPLIKKTSISNKIMLVLVARHLASKLQQKLKRDKIIEEKASVEELSEMLKMKKGVVYARLKELKDGRKVITEERGIYRIAPYEIESFLATLGKGEKNEGRNNHSD